MFLMNHKCYKGSSMQKKLDYAGYVFFLQSRLLYTVPHMNQKKQPFIVEVKDTLKQKLNGV